MDYTVARECKNEEVLYTCYQCGKCGRVFENGFMVDDGGFWCKEDCKLLQVRPITRKRKVEKILSNSDAVYALYADGTWRKKDK